MEIDSEKIVSDIKKINIILIIFIFLINKFYMLFIILISGDYHELLYSIFMLMLSNSVLDIFILIFTLPFIFLQIFKIKKISKYSVNKSMLIPKIVLTLSVLFFIIHSYSVYSETTSSIRFNKEYCKSAPDYEKQFDPSCF